MPRTLALFVLILGGVLLATTTTDGLAADPRSIWLAVVKADLAKPLEPLAQWRRRQGFDTVVSSNSIEAALAALPRRPRFLLLVGDDDGGKQPTAWRLSAKRMELYRWRSAQPKEFVSDVAWGDLEGDGVPDIPVGRIPARTPAEVELIVGKIVAYEKQPPTSADLQVAVWLGSPEYNATVNAAASGLGVALFQTGGPPWLRPWFVSGNPGDPFCGWPTQQAVRFTRQMRQGGIANILMGHASADAFYSMAFGGKPIWYTATDAAALLGKGPPAAPMFFFSCESGNFARPTPCETKAFLLLPGGPVAAVGATTESHPLTNYFSGVCLLKALGGRERRIGALWLNAQLEAKRSSNFLIEAVLRDVEGKLEPEINVAKLRRDQVLMYAMLGDPATRLRLPEPLEAGVERTPTSWRWKAKRPPGAVRLEAGFRALRPTLPSWEGLRAGEENAVRTFEAANAAFAFAPLPSADRWEGQVDRPGWIRLVATGGDAIHVAVLKAE